MGSVHSESYREFLRRLRAARLEACLTQREAARALGKHQSWISKCESGERRIDAVELSAFARLYGKSIGHFLARDG